MFTLTMNTDGNAKSFKKFERFFSSFRIPYMPCCLRGKENGSNGRKNLDMKSPLKILHLEDNADDAELVRVSLDMAGIAFSMTRVESRQDFVTALERGGLDLIISDFRLPSFDGMAALEAARARMPATPFIFVSGTPGEDMAIDSLKCGATDYVFKERLFRLVPAVRRAMREIEDREEHRRLQQQFVEAQKMEVVGRLAGGIAHDFNNILSVILGYSHLMADELEPGTCLKDYAEEIRQAAQRAIALTRQLLIFSRKQAVQLQVLDLNEIVKQMEKMLRCIIERNIELKVVPGKIGRIKADAGQIEQVLMNLVINARDAMPAGGKLTINTQEVLFDHDGQAAPAEIAAGTYVVLAVCDTGAGMSNDVKARLFEPFFTTKPKGKGTGLGLATCRTILKQCGGHIEVHSVEGSGTTFKIYFPRADQPADAAVQLPETGTAAELLSPVGSQRENCAAN